jgi:hypothetical protein
VYKNDFDQALDEFLSAKNGKKEDGNSSSLLPTQGKSYSQEDEMFLAYVR